MKDQLAQLVTSALNQIANEAKTSIAWPEVQIERTRDRSHGDFACNIAMLSAKALKKAPRQIAEQIVAALPDSQFVTKTEIAGPGFINFYLSDAAMQAVVQHVLQAGNDYGQSQLGQQESVQVEFVSANPTGPLHVGHGRGAAYGASLANLLETAGFQVHREYYVNDAGRQMNILAASVWLRYLEQFDEPVTFPSAGYKGTYIYDIAAELKSEQGSSLRQAAADVATGLPSDGPETADAHIDALIERAKTLLGEQKYEQVFSKALTTIRDDIRNDLAEFGVVFNEWFSERGLVSSGAVDHAMETLKQHGAVYEQNGALWFRSTDYGDDKDRVLIRDNGQATYFASDVAYHLNKVERGFKRIFNIWGADHHGYIARVKASMQAMGIDSEALNVLLVQFAVLYRGSEKVAMSTRSGQFVTLRELRDEVGSDAARFFYVMRANDQHLDFDLELAKSREKDNPVYYIQYAHARVHSLLRKLEERQLQYQQYNGLQQLAKLDSEHERALMYELSRYPEVVESSARQYAPHSIAHYLRDLANRFHTYYNEHKVLGDDSDLRDARLTLGLATAQVIRNGLKILGVSAPSTM